MKCIKCGKELRDGAKFCSGCGFAVENHSEKAEENSAADAEAAVTSPEEETVTVTSETGTEKKKSGVIPIVCLVLAAAGLVTGGIVYRNRSVQENSRADLNSEISEITNTEETAPVTDIISESAAITEEAVSEETSVVTGITEETVTEVQPSQEENADVLSDRGYGIVITDSDPLNIRSGPGTDTDVIGQVDKGYLVYVTGKEGDWYKIKSMQSYGLEGYVLSDYIDLSKKSWKEKYTDFINSYFYQYDSKNDYDYKKSAYLALVNLNSEDDIPELIINLMGDSSGGEVIAGYSDGNVIDLSLEAGAASNWLDYYDGSGQFIAGRCRYLGTSYQVFQFDGKTCTLLYNFEHLMNGEEYYINGFDVGEETFNNEIAEYENLVRKDTKNNTERHNGYEMLEILGS